MKILSAIKVGVVLIAVAMLGNRLSMAEDAKPLYEMNFEQAEVGKVPEGFLVIEGAFEVKQEEGNKFLELPGAPLDSFGLLFGPTEKSGVSVSARIRSTNKGRRYPAFGVGLNGQSGYRLQVSPGKKALEIYKGDLVVASTPYDWKSDEWTMFQFQITKAGNVWKLAGKVWVQGATEPAQAMVSYDETEEPSPGRASVWGNPFATTPIQFDDLVVRSVPEGKAQ
jgi:hypothetical protein